MKRITDKAAMTTWDYAKSLGGNTDAIRQAAHEWSMDDVPAYVNMYNELMTIKTNTEKLS